MKTRIVQAHVTGRPEAVWSRLHNVAAWAKWRPSIQRVSNVSDDPVQQASAWTEHRTISGRTVALLCHAVELEPGKAFAYTARGDGIRYTTRWTTVWDEDATLVTQSTSISASGMRNRLAGLANELLEQEDHNLDHLRPLVRPHGVET